MRQRRALGLTFRLLRRVRRHRAVLIGALVAMAVVALAEAAPIPLGRAAVGVLFSQDGEGGQSEYTQWFLDAGTGILERLGFDVDDPRQAALWFIVGVVLLVGAISTVATWSSLFLGKYMAALVVKDLRGSMMRKVLAMPVAWFTKRKTGDLVSRFSTDVEITYQGINVFLTVFVLQPMVFVAAAVAAFVLTPRLALATVLVMPLVLVPIMLIGRKVRKHSHKSLVSQGEATEAVNQVLSGLRVIKAFSAEGHEEDRYERVNQRWLKRQSKMLRAKAATRSLMDMLYGVSLAVVLGLGGWLILTEQWDLTADKFLAFLIALATMYGPLRRLTRAYNSYQAAMGAAERVFAVLDQEEGAGDAPDAIAVGPVRESIVFDDVSFSYRDDDDEPTSVLRNISFEIPAGKTVALVGPSGSGKSTIADLLFRFRRPDSGEVRFDGLALDRVRHDSLLDQIAIVSQRPFVFNTTIRENIAYARRDATQEQIEAAARAAQIHDLVASLPDGYDSLVGDQGAALSGGQLQRVTIARAILKDASFLLLDEATSNLDAESERAVQVALKNLLEGRTTLVIAHRLSTIVDTDLILVVEDGRIVEEGTHEELLARAGTYARLYRSSA